MPEVRMSLQSVSVRIQQMWVFFVLIAHNGDAKCAEVSPCYVSCSDTYHLELCRPHVTYKKG